MIPQTRNDNPLSRATEHDARRAAARVDLWLRKSGARYQLVTIAGPNGWDRFSPGTVLEDGLTLDGVMQFCAGVH